MLHIVNGDSVAHKLRQGEIQGDILVWREVYPHGPVFSEMAEGSNRATRAQYLEQTLGIPQADYIQGCLNQEKTLQDFRKYREIVLWFEHDLFDQTMMCYLLHWFSQQPLDGTKLSLLCIGEYPGIELFRGLGQLSPRQLQTLSGTWHPIDQQELELGRKFWKAYSSPNIDEHIAFLQEDTSALPFSREAFEGHLSRLPSTSNGLGIIEQTTLGVVAGGISSPKELFVRVGNHLNTLGMGDLEYWYRLAKMSEEPCSLLHIQGNVEFPNFLKNPSSFHECAITLTELGQKVLSGKEDWTALKSIDEWFGGLRLQGKVPWRWDASHQMILQS